MTLSAEDRAVAAPPVARRTCRSCGARLFATIVGPRCPVHGAEGVR